MTTLQVDWIQDLLVLEAWLTATCGPQGTAWHWFGHTIVFAKPAHRTLYLLYRVHNGRT